MNAEPRKTCLYTIGHSDANQTDLISALKTYAVDVVVDVRSSPYSRRNPQFNREALQHSFRGACIRYLFLGRELGARREEPECYVNGQARYDLIEKSESFRCGLERLRKGLEKFHVALLCAESDPITCHRMVLICKCLRNDETEIRHIRRDATYETNQQAEMRMLNAVGLNTSFATPAILEKAYQLQADRIAYVDQLESLPTIDAEQQRSVELKLW